MRSCFIALYFPVQFSDVVRDCHKDTFCINIFDASAFISSEFTIFFQFSKGTFCLNASVHSEHSSFFACDSVHAFFSLAYKLTRYFYFFESLILGHFPVAPFDAAILIWTSGTFKAFVFSYFPNVAGLCSPVFYVICNQTFAVFTYVVISVGIIFHILGKAYVALVFPCL